MAPRPRRAAPTRARRPASSVSASAARPGTAAAASRIHAAAQASAACGTHSRRSASALRTPARRRATAESEATTARTGTAAPSPSAPASISAAARLRRAPSRPASHSAAFRPATRARHRTPRESAVVARATRGRGCATEDRGRSHEGRLAVRVERRRSLDVSHPCWSVARPGVGEAKHAVSRLRRLGLRRAVPGRGRQLLVPSRASLSRTTAS